MDLATASGRVDFNGHVNDEQTKEIQELLERLASFEPRIAETFRQVVSFISVTKADVLAKKAALQLQRSKVSPKHVAVRHYLACQLFMLNIHKYNVDTILADAKAVVSSLLRDAEIAESDRDRSSRSRDKVGEACDKMERMKRSCKRVLDVTDRFCVIDDKELDLMKEEEKLAESSPTPGVNSDRRALSAETLLSLGNHLKVIRRSFGASRINLVW